MSISRRQLMLTAAAAAVAPSIPAAPIAPAVVDFSAMVYPPVVMAERVWTMNSSKIWWLAAPGGEGLASIDHRGQS